MTPTRDTLAWMYHRMVQSRYLETSIETIYMEGKKPQFNMANGPIPGEMHLSNGQEPVAVGVCAHLMRDDVVTATHRPHHIALAKGVDLDAMVAEIFGKATGLAGGRGGHMHLIDPTVNFACSGIIAEGMGPAAGAALARVLREQPGVAVAFIGEGAANQGAFHEVMNLAALWRLPFVCIIEDNSWGISVSKAQSTAVPSNHVRAAAYGIPGERVEGNDPLAIFAAAGRAIARARNGDGPTLLEVETLRLVGHFMGDAEGYRSTEEKQDLAQRDPIPHFHRRLCDELSFDAGELAALESEARRQVDRAITQARAAPEPEEKDTLTQVFVEAVA